MKYLNAVLAQVQRRVVLKFLIPTVLVIALGVFAAGVIVSMRISADIRKSARAKAKADTARIIERLEAVNRLRLQMVKGGLGMLKEEAAERGVRTPPSVR